MSTHPKRVKAIRWHDIEDVRLDDVEVPPLKDDQVLVRWLYGGICGTDRHSLHSGTMVEKGNPLNYPAILGHEGCGQILELGKNVARDSIGQLIKAGDLVEVTARLESSGNTSRRLAYEAKVGGETVCKGHAIAVARQYGAED